MVFRHESPPLLLMVELLCRGKGVFNILRVYLAVPEDARALTLPVDDESEYYWVAHLLSGRVRAAGVTVTGWYDGKKFYAESVNRCTDWESTCAWLARVGLGVEHATVTNKVLKEREY